MKSGTHFLPSFLSEIAIHFREIFCRYLVVLSCITCGVSGTVWAQNASFEFSDDLVSSDGNYRVKVNIEFPSDCRYQPCHVDYVLWENGVTIRSGTGYTSMVQNPPPFEFGINRSKGSGVYTYEIGLIYVVGGTEDPSWEVQSPAVTVIRSDVSVDNPGFHGDYEIHRGDINGDGRLDFYIRSKPGNPAPVSDFILRQATSKDFTLLNALTSSQRSQAQQWPLANIELTTGDFNADGAVDVLLEGVGSLVSGAFDQLVFSPRAANAPPLVVTALDQQVQKFFAEVGNALYDPNYFQNYAPVAVQQREVLDWVFGPEYCFSSPEAEPHGPLEFWPRLGPGEFDSYGAFVSHSAAFLSDCYARGYNYVHYDWLEVIYKVLVGSKDISVFSPDAVEISRVLRTILEDWSLPDGSNEKETIRVILESIFGMPVFGPALDDDEEIHSLFSGIGYFIRRSKGAEASPLAKCPALSTAEYNARYAAHLSNFSFNSELATKISVKDDPEGSQGDKLIEMDLTFAGLTSFDDAYAKSAADAAKGWSSCGKLPSGKTVRLKVVANKLEPAGVDSADIKVQRTPGPDARCEKVAGFVRDAEQSKIYFCPEANRNKEHVAFHEFGHVLGFKDKYVTDKGSPDYGKPLAGFENDVMSSTGLMILPYHLGILLEKYQ